MEALNITGGGGNFFDRRDNIRSDAKLIERAVRKKWKINPALFDVIPDLAAEIAVNKEKYNTGERLSAMRLLGTLNGQNQKDDYAEKQQPAAVQVNVQVNGLTDNQRNREIANLLDAARARAITCTARDTNGDGVNATTRDDARPLAGESP